MLHLYIADMDPAFISRVRQALRRTRRIDITGTASNGRCALSEIIRLKPDILLTDLQLPEIDGITLLRRVRRLANAPAVIVCTRFYSATSMDWAFKHGASFFLCKPIDYDRLPELLLDCAESIQRGEERDSNEPAAFSEQAVEIQAMLCEMGISPHLNGGVYLLECVRSVQNNPMLLRNLSQGLYEDLALRLGTSASRIERSIRNAIFIGYERGSLRQRFPRRPTNRQLIEYLLDRFNEPTPMLSESRER